MKFPKPQTSFLLLLMFVATNVFTQQNFNGQVLVSGSRQPLELATIEGLPGQRVLSDAQGHFSITGSGNSLTITVSFVGFKSKKLSLETRNTTVIFLEPDAVRLEELSLVTTSAARFRSLARVDLALRPVTNTQELLRVVPGLFIAQHAGGGKAEQIFLRGFDCDHGTDVAVSVDGMPVNMVSHAHGQGYADAHFIIPELVQHVDYGAGPYYATQGNLTTAGYVQFRTADAIDKSRVQIEGGRFGSFRAMAVTDILKKHKDRGQAYVAGEYFYSDGPTTHPQDFSRVNLFGKFHHALGSRHWLTISTSHFSSGWYASGQVPGRAVDSIGRFGSIDPTEGGVTQRQNINLQLHSRLSDQTTWENQFYFSRYRFKLFSNFSFFLNDPLHGDGIEQAESRNLFGGLSKLTLKYALGGSQAQTLLGIGFRADATNDSRLAHQQARALLGYIQRGDIREQNYFAYASQQLTRGRWVAEAALRLDALRFKYNDRISTIQPGAQSKLIFQPKFNLQYTLSRQVQFVGKLGRGFHSNDTRVVAARQGHDILPAAWGIDFGINLKPAPGLFISLTTWLLKLQQEFVYVGDEGVVEPGGRTLRRGIDVVARYQFAPYFYGTTNLNFTAPKSLDAAKGEDHIPLAPTFSSVGGIYYKRGSGINGGISYRWLSDRPANEDNSIVAKGYFVTDLQLNYTQPHYEIGLGVENLFNIDWNEAQFATKSQLRNEAAPVEELHFTPGTPFQLRLKFAVLF
jgi:hypothetical protein